MTGLPTARTPCQPTANGVDVAPPRSPLCRSRDLLPKPCRGAGWPLRRRRALKPVSCCQRRGRMIHEQATGQPDLNSHDIAVNGG